MGLIKNEVYRKESTMWVLLKSKGSRFFLNNVLLVQIRGMGSAVCLRLSAHCNGQIRGTKSVVRRPGLYLI